MLNGIKSLTPSYTGNISSLLNQYVISNTLAPSLFSSIAKPNHATPPLALIRSKCIDTSESKGVTYIH